MRYLQFVQTITFAMLVMTTIASKINRRQYWEIPRPRLGWFEVIFGDMNRQSAYWKEHFRMRKETFYKTVAIDILGRKRSLVKNIIAQATILKRGIKK